MDASAWAASRRRYAILNAAMILLMIATLFAATLYAPKAPTAIIITFVVLWNVVSFRRVADTRLAWLHLAPYLTLLGLGLLYWGLLEGAGNGPWVIGYVPTPWWHTVLQVTGIPMVLAWPVATTLLSLIPSKELRS